MAMNPSSSVNVPVATIIQPLSSSLMDKFLGLSVSPASVQSLSSDTTTDANDLDELDEQEIWGIEINTNVNSSSAGNNSNKLHSYGYGFGGSSFNQASAPLPPRMDRNRRSVITGTTPELLYISRSPLGDGSPSVASIMANSSSPSSPWISPTAHVSTNNSIGSLSGMFHSLSPVNSNSNDQNNSSRSPRVRVLSGEAMARRTPSATRMIPRMMASHQQIQAQSTSSEKNSSKSLFMIPQSAPLNIPDWSKFSHYEGKLSQQGSKGKAKGRRRSLHRSNSKEREEGNGKEAENDEGGDEGEEKNKNNYDDDDDEEEDDNDDERLPPHEFLAREYAKSERTSFSVLEGAGRTLKGRDLSRVRNAVLTYTGFVE